MLDFQQVKKAFKQKFINQIIRITTKNKRVFQGTFKAIDFRSNLIIHNAVAQIPDDQNVPLNGQLNTLYDTKLIYIPDPKLSEQQQKIAKDKYFKSHYFIGSVMISGDDILKAELRTPPIVVVDQPIKNKNEEQKQNKKQ